MSDLHLGILLAFVSAFTFVGQNFWLRELQAREGPWRYLLIINGAPALLGVASWVFLPPDLSWTLVRGSIYASVPGLAGMMMLGLAVHFGNMSHVGPVIGSKPLITTAVAAMLGLEATPRDMWVASAMLLVALFLMAGNREVLLRPWRVLEPAVALALGFCASYSVCDLITRQQLVEYDLRMWDYLVMNWIVRTVMVGLPLSILWATRGWRIWPERRSTALWTIPASTLHGIAFMAAIQLTGSAVLTNVLASVRGLLSVVAVIVLARWGLVRKEPMTRPVVVARIVGSLLVCLAIYVGLRDQLAASAPTAADPPTAGASGGEAPERK